MATAKIRGLVAVSIRQRESSPWRKEGKEVLAGQYLDKAGEAKLVGLNHEDSMSVIIETSLVFDVTMPRSWTVSSGHHSNKGIRDAGSTADIRMLWPWSALVCLGLL